MYISTKVFDNYSVALRQWKAGHSHCQLLHGYALKFKVWFTAEKLDEMNWVVDFGGFGHNGFKEWMNNMFDHTLLIEIDDPYRDLFDQMGQMNLCKVQFLENMGCESLAKLVFDKLAYILEHQNGGRCKVIKVEVFENDKNSGIYEIKS
jgi:6-pyruvoyltetrahydropterin/6-carboxytetrahydropterin synthase